MPENWSPGCGRADGTTGTPAADVARAGVALYRVLAVGHEPGHQLVAVDGGLSDNPRPAVYGARCTAVLVGRPARPRPCPRPWPAATTRPVTCSCATSRAATGAMAGPLPDDLRPGGLLAVPGCGAYHFPLASNYDLVGRPPLIAVQDGQARVLVRRETLDDVLRRDAA